MVKVSALRPYCLAVTVRGNTLRIQFSLLYDQQAQKERYECSIKKDQTTDKRFDEKLIQTTEQGSLISIWVDRQTGVNYLYTWSAQGCTLTPLFGETSKVIVTPVED